MSKNDVLFLCQFFYPEYVSSATLPFDTALALKKAGFTVGALVGYPKEYSRFDKVPVRESVHGIEIRRVKYLQLKRGMFLGRIVNYLSFTMAAFTRLRLLSKYKVVVVYSNPPILPLLAVVAKKLFGTKIVFVCYDVYPEMAVITNSIRSDGMISRFMRFINRYLFQCADKIIALSSEMKTFLLEHRSGLTEDRVEVIPNWHKDYEEMAPAALPEKKKEETFTVSYFGNLGICQDLDTILGTVRQLKDEPGIQFVFAGHGTKMAELKSIAAREKLKNVVIHDFLHGEQYAKALQNSDCFIVSLAEELTGLAVPSKTYSYMMAGRPILAIIGEHSDIARDLQTNNAGYVIGSGQSARLTDAVRQLQSNRALCSEMGINCRRIFLMKYTENVCTSKYVGVFSKLLGRNSFV